MPDWFYHPVYRPIVKRLFSPATAQRITLTAMRLQASNRYGQALFRWLAHAKPPASAAVEALGLHFPSAIGLGPGIDVHGEAIDLWPALGLGFVQLGPVGASPVARHYSTDPLLLEELSCVISSEECAGSSARDLSAPLARARHDAPVGIALRGPRLCDALEEVAERADFFTLPWGSRLGAEARREAQSLRAATRKPLVARLMVDSWDDDLDRAIDCASEIGLDGCVVVHGEASPLRQRGWLHGQQSQKHVLELIERAAHRAGARFAIIGSCGVLTPDDALAMLDRGAKLVQLYEGLIYAGPGLPKRIVKRQLERERALRPPARPDDEAASQRPAALGSLLASLFGAAVMLMGVAALALAATARGLPGGLDSENHVGKPLIDFIAHNRVCLAGSLFGLGAMALWLGRGPLARREAWAWWTLLLSGLAPILIVAAHLQRHAAYAVGVAVFLGLWAPALAFSLPGAGSRAQPRARAWTWSPAGLGRLWLSFWAAGGVLGGALIWLVGSTKIFVPQDLHYLGCSPDGMSPAIAPFIAQDRIAFGAVLLTASLVALPCIWFGTRPAARALWAILVAIWVIGVLTAIGVHFVINYISFTHLAPFLMKDLAFIFGAALLFRPIFRGDARQPHFRDL